MGTYALLLKAIVMVQEHLDNDSLCQCDDCRAMWALIESIKRAEGI